MQINCLSTALPKDCFSTEELLKTFPCVLPEGVRQNVINLGVSKRHLVNHSRISSEEETAESEKQLIGLCLEACSDAVKEADLSMKEVDYLVTAYDTSPFLSPGLSQLLLPRLGLDPYAKHVNEHGIASTAFIKALELAGDHLSLFPRHKVLVCISGVSSFWFQNQVRGIKSVLDIKQINSLRHDYAKQRELKKWMATMQFFLFGDGVAATIITSENRGIVVDRVAEVTNISANDYLAGYSRLEVSDEPFKFGFYSRLGREIPELGVKYTGLALKRLLGGELDEIVATARKWAIHTGSGKILDSLAEHNGIPTEKVAESHAVLNECGNLAGASLPFILERIMKGTRFAENDVVMMLGYGWGFSSSACKLTKR
jgi:predicted naringenin-chalcone synthase